MHAFLPAIGFSKLTKSQLDDLLIEATLRPDNIDTCINEEGREIVEISYYVADGIGLKLIGTIDENDDFIMDYFFPYMESDIISSKSDIDVIKQTDREGYQIVCDEYRLGISLICKLSNMVYFLRDLNGINVDYVNDANVSLIGLASEGTIILPIISVEKEKEKVNLEKRRDMIEAAREGDVEAIESLTMEDYDTYSMISKRISKEDILSIVKSYFMPYGIENDKYAICGEIVDYKRIVNHISMEEMYVLYVESNDVTFSIIINSNDLLGQPAKGRRFKGNIWLQGSLLS